jgi:serine/threonine protein phosphatase 1
MSHTYAVPDLHGRYDLLVAAIERIGDRAGGKPYTLVTLGDYVDKGPQSKQIIDRLSRGNLPGEGKLVCLAGNHEAMMLETLTTPLDPGWWISNGGDATLLSYGHPVDGAYHAEVVPQEHVDWLRALSFIHVDRHRVFVHASVDPAVPLDGQSENRLLWYRYPSGANKGYGDRHIVHGHHPFEDGPKLFSGRTDLDTLAWKTGRLVVGVFDDEQPGGPIDLIEIQIEPRASR